MSTDDFLDLLRDELGLPVGPADLDRSLDEVPGWDSVHLIWLLSVLDRRIGHSIALPEAMTAGSLNGLYQVVTGR